MHRVVTLLRQESLAPCHMPCCQDLLKLHLRLWKLRRLKRSCNKPGYLQLDLEVKTSCRTSSSLILCIPLLSFDCHGVCYSAIHCAKICQVSMGLGYHSESRTDVQPLAYSERRIEIAEDVCLQTCFAQRSNSASESFRCRICSGDSNFAERLPLQRSLAKQHLRASHTTVLPSHPKD